MSDSKDTISALENLRDFADGPIIGALVNIANSNFGAAAMGAFAGAGAAYYLSISLSHKERKINQLLATNAAASWAISVFNHSIGYKRQLAGPVVQEFRHQQLRYKEYEEAGGSGVFEIEFDFVTLSPPSYDTQGLSAQIAEKTGAEAKTILASYYLHQCYDSFKVSILARGDAISFLGSLRGTDAEKELVPRYLGLPLPDFGMDARFRDAIFGIHHQMDGVIFFSYYLAVKLSKRAQILSSSIGQNAPKPVSFTVSLEAIQGLMPSPDEFPDWDL